MDTDTGGPAVGRTARPVWPAVWLAGLLLATAVLLGAGVTPWPMIACELILAVLVMGRVMSWSAALSIAVAGALALAALVVRITPLVGAPLGLSIGIVLSTLGIALLVALILVPGRLPSLRVVVLGASVTLIPLLCLAVLVLAGLRGRLSYFWAMRNDAVWNMVIARLMVADSGLRPDLHANPSPLTPTLIAIATSFGRDGVSAQELLTHDVSRAAELWMVLAATSAVLAGAIGVRMSQRGPLQLRLAAGVVGSGLPLLWFVLGYSLEFGFYNASISLVILISAWLAWLNSDAHPSAALLGVSLAMIAILATWGPLVVAVTPLYLVSAIRLVLRRHNQRRSHLIVAWAGGAAAAFYGALIALPDLREQGGALSANGGIFPLPAGQAVITLGVASGIIVIYSAIAKDAILGVGFASVISFSLAGFAFLTIQRHSFGLLEGYYPVKFAWMVLTFLIIVAVSALFAAATELRGRLIAGGLVVVTGLAVLVSVSWQMGPRFPPPISNVFPIANIVGDSGVAAPAPAGAEVLSIARKGERGIAFQLVSAEYDRFANTWLLQLESVSSSDPIRKWAYYLNPEDTGQLCQAMQDWVSPVVIHTSNPDLESELAGTCPGVTYSVDLSVR